MMHYMSKKVCSAMAKKYTVVAIVEVLPPCSNPSVLAESFLLEGQDVYNVKSVSAGFRYLNEMFRYLEQLFQMSTKVFFSFKGMNDLQTTNRQSSCRTQLVS